MQCEVCGKIRNEKHRRFHEHHISYIPERIIILCKECHYALHNIPLFALFKLLEIKWMYGEKWEKQFKELFSDPANGDRKKLQTLYYAWQKKANPEKIRKYHKDKEDLVKIERDKIFPKVDRICVECGNHFLCSPLSKRQTCSTKCSLIYRARNHISRNRRRKIHDGRN